ncbi:MAG: VOC family protein [bacterium]
MPRPKDTTATLIPSFRYKDAPTAIEWLCRAFGFTKQLVVPGEGETIAHAQLVFGHGMIMLGSANTHGGGYDDLVSTPAEAGTNTQSAYVIVDDADAHYAIAKASGAEMVPDIQDQDYGGRGYTCKDLEGVSLELRRLRSVGTLK